MGLYVHSGDADSLRSVDLRELERLVDEAVWQSRSGELHSLRLASCGQYVSGRLYRFDQAIAAHNKAKAIEKRAETAVRVSKDGMNLVQAVRYMKNRMEEEQRDKEIFVVENSVMHPYRFTPRMNVRVSYRWRDTLDDSGTYGSINFRHEVDTRPDYTLPTPKRKPSRAKQEDEFQDKLYHVWDHLR